MRITSLAPTQDLRPPLAVDPVFLARLVFNWPLSGNRSVRRCLVCLVWLTFAFVSASAAQPAPRSVLVLHSLDIGYATDAAFARAFRAELSKQSHEPINFFDASLRPTPSAGAVQEEVVANYLRSSLAGQRLDLVMTISAPAALFARKYREQLFPTTPLLLAGVDQRWVQNEVLTASEAVVPIVIDPVRIVEDIVRIRPQTTNLIAVLGDSPLERAWRDELAREFQPLAERLTLTWFNELSFTEMLKRSAALPANSAILYLLLSVDAKGFTHSEDRVLAELHETANVPALRRVQSPDGERSGRRSHPVGRRCGQRDGEYRRTPPERRISSDRQDAPPGGRESDVRLARAAALGYQRCTVCPQGASYCSGSLACGSSIGRTS